MLALQSIRGNPIQVEFVESSRENFSPARIQVIVSSVSYCTRRGLSEFLCDFNPPWIHLILQCSALLHRIHYMKVQLARTSTLPAERPWARLEPRHVGSQAVQLFKLKYSIGRKDDNDLRLNDQKISSYHCQLQKQGRSARLFDKSSNGIFVGSKKIGKNSEHIVNHGEVIWILHESLVGPSQAIGYQLRICEMEQQQERKKGEEEQLRKKEQLQKKAKAQNQQKIKLQLQELKKKKSGDLAAKLLQQITCPMCLEIIFLPVTVHPCNHHFCGGCLSSWVVKSQECPQCRKKLLTAQRDASWNQVIQQYLKNNPQSCKSKQDKQLDQKANVFTFNTYYFAKQEPKAQKKEKDPPRRRRRRSDSQQSAQDIPNKICPQCTTPRMGFKCPPGGQHLNCNNCGSAFANRLDNLNFPQSCAICQKSYCNLYNKTCKGRGVNLHLVKNRHARKPVFFDLSMLRGNQYQFQLYSKLLKQQRIDAGGLFEWMVDWIGKNNFQFLVDRKIMQNTKAVSRAVQIKPLTPVCQNCWRQLWFQMVFRALEQRRMKLGQRQRNRMDCYWGINCSTMRTKFQHSQKLNHLCFQTKFTN